MAELFQWEGTPNAAYRAVLDRMIDSFPQVMFDRLKGNKIILVERFSDGDLAFARAAYDFANDRGLLFLNIKGITEEELVGSDLIWHELKHIEQYRTGILKQFWLLNGDYRWIWNGGIYEHPTDSMAVAMLPWEVEAYKAQAEYTAAFIDTTRNAQWHYEKLMAEMRHLF